MQYNTQKPEKQIRLLSDQLSVHSIFHTIQGEGPFCGTPAVFVRLAGCNLQCPLCDTDYTTGRKDMDVIAVLDEVNKLTRENKTSLVVITGGEPFRQNLYSLFKVLVMYGYFVQVETNGTLAPPQDDELWKYNHNVAEREGVYIVCSPKTGKVHPRIHELCCAYKYVASYGNINPNDGLPMHPLEHPSLKGVPRPRHSQAPVYLQPTDHKDAKLNKLNLDAVVESCLKHGHILQLQVHKLIGVE